MNLLRDNMLHKQLTSIKNEKGSLTLSLNDGSIITLFNHIKTPIEQSLIGKTITDVKLNADVLKIIFNGTGNIEMGIKADDYVGPEAFLYRGNNGVFISS